MGLGLSVAWVPALSTVRTLDCDALMDSVALGQQHNREGQTGPLTAVVLPIRFTKPYAAAGVFLAVPAGSPAHRFEDLDGRKVGVIVSSLEHEVLAKKGVNLSVFAFPEDIVAALERGELGAGALAAPFLV
jgi:ABC-type amino acid transport substrate-binding protein